VSSTDDVGFLDQAEDVTVGTTGIDGQMYTIGRMLICNDVDRLQVEIDNINDH
jgi:hypothetical protein